MRTGLLALTASLMLAALAPAGSPAGVGTAVAQEPPSLGSIAARAIDADGRPLPGGFFKETVAPGASFMGTVVIANTSRDDAVLRVYAARGMTGTTTGIVYGPRGDTGGMAGWMTLGRRSLRVPAGGEQRVGFRVDVPADARPGDHIAAVTMESPPVEREDGQFAIDQVFRTAVAVQLRVSGKAERQLRVGELAIKPLGGTQVPALVVDLTNSGQLFCGPLLTAQLDYDGERVGTVERRLGTILPDDSLPFELAWPQPLAAGTYRATVSARGCGPQSQVVRDVVLSGDLGGTMQQPGTNLTPESSSGVPVWALVLTGFVALLIGVLLARRRPREREDD